MILTEKEARLLADGEVIDLDAETLIKLQGTSVLESHVIENEDWTDGEEWSEWEYACDEDDIVVLD